MKVKSPKSIKKLIAPNSVSKLKLMKFKERINDKLFTKMMMDGMSPQKQNLIRMSFNHKLKTQIAKPLKTVSLS